MAASVQQWFPFSLEPAVEQVIRQVDFSWCMEDPVIANLPGDAPFWIVRRENSINYWRIKPSELARNAAQASRLTASTAGETSGR